MHRRRSIRLKGYDYARPGAYFVTICARRRDKPFGSLQEGRLLPSPAGRMVGWWWMQMPGRFPHLVPDEWVLMPDHLHAIIVVPGGPERGGHIGPPLPRVVQWYKTMTTNAYLHGVKRRGWPPVPGRLWQRNYYERIIRTDRELDAVRRYIRENPIRYRHPS